MKKFLVILVVMILLLSACTPQAPKAEDVQSPVNEERQAEAQGEIQDGLRQLTLEAGFSKGEIQVYRGETLNIMYKPSGDRATRIVIEDLDIDESFEANSVVSVVVKVKEVGSYEIAITANDMEERGVIQVIDYEKENVFINASAEEFNEAMKDDHLLLDVRTLEEYKMGHIEGATLIPVSELANRIDEIEDYKDVPVLVYCRSGNRSITASQILIESGFKHIVNLRRGISAYQASN